jgi:nucleoside 2-deoxyribosyltransferase
MRNGGIYQLKILKKFMKKMTVIKPPTKIEVGKDALVIFLGGSIEMGKAEEWQTKLSKDIEEFDVIALNPRRSDWDSSWVQSIENKQFNEQVTWELSGLERADIVVIYLAKNTMSPITLLELGINIVEKPDSVVVYADEKYERKGNVDITCKRHGVVVHSDYEEFLNALKNKIKLRKIKVKK